MFLKFAHQIWKNHLQPGDVAIDATCGNGYDAEVLASMELSHLYLFDIQKEALEATQKRVGIKENISHHLECHSNFSSIRSPVQLIVYNLGYLPGGNKKITTRVETTLKSLETGLECLSSGGMISCMLYPGHEEGKRETAVLLEVAAALPRKNFQVSHHHALNLHSSPSLLLIYRS